MPDEDVFGALDSRTETPGNDFADWWEPNESGDELVGIVVEMHSAPQNWTDPGEVPDSIYTILSVGRGDEDEGVAYTPKLHKQLKQGLRSVSLHDLVKLRFTGYDKINAQAQPMMTYEIGIVSHEEWSELDGADTINDLLEAYNGVSGDNRRQTPYGQNDASDDSSDDISPADTELGQAAAALRELIDIQGGSVDSDKAQKILTDIRGFDVDIEDAALYAGLEIVDDTIQ